MKFYLYLDDMRLPDFTDFPSDHKETALVIARSGREFIEVVRQLGLPAFVSFDHDLHADHYPRSAKEQESGHQIDYANDPRYQGDAGMTGWHCAKWLIEFCKDARMALPPWRVHSMNVPGGANIRRILNLYESKAI